MNLLTDLIITFLSLFLCLGVLIILGIFIDIAYQLVVLRRIEQQRNQFFKEWDQSITELREIVHEWNEMEKIK